MELLTSRQLGQHLAPGTAGDGTQALARHLAKEFVGKRRLPILDYRESLFGFKEGRAVSGEVVPAISMLIQD